MESSSPLRDEAFGASVYCAAARSGKLPITPRRKRHTRRSIRFGSAAESVDPAVPERIEIKPDLVGKFAKDATNRLRSSYDWYIFAGIKMARSNARRPTQQSLTFRTWGGHRKGAGRPVGKGRRNSPHEKRS